jgi:hypothetical protein
MASGTVFVNIWQIAALQTFGVFCYVTRELTAVTDVVVVALFIEIIYRQKRRAG